MGPFCYLRPGTVLEAGAKAGTFVEIKNSLIGERTKVPHLSYIGDADIGADTNIAAGNITVNQDHGPREGADRPSGATSGPGSTMRSSPRCRSATTHGLQPAPSSQRMSLQARSPSPAPSRSTRRGGVESGTIEQTLPGLEAEIPRVEMSTGPRDPADPEEAADGVRGPLASRARVEVAEQLGVELGEIELTTFANGETYCRYCESIAVPTSSSCRQAAAPSTRTSWSCSS